MLESVLVSCTAFALPEWNDSALLELARMDEIDLDKEAFETVLGHLRKDRREEALKRILPEVEDDEELAQKILASIERSRKKSKSASQKEAKRKARESDSEAKDFEGRPFTTISFSPSSAPRKKRKTAFHGDHKGIKEIDLDKETYQEVVDLLEREKSEEAYALILEETNRNETLAKQVLSGIKRSLPKKPKSSKSEATSDNNASLDLPEPPPQKSEGKKEHQESLAPPPPPRDSEIEADIPVRKTRKIVGPAFLVCLLIATIFATVHFWPAEGTGAGPSNQDMMNFVTVVLCPPLEIELELNSSQQAYCIRKRKQFARVLYDECRRIDGLDEIRGPFSEETLEAALVALGKEVKGELTRSQRKRFLEFYEAKKWGPVDIIDENGQKRLEYPPYGAVSGTIFLSLASGK